MESVLIAAIAAVPSTLAAAASWRQSKRAAVSSNKAATIAEGNGKGPVDKMLEQVIDKLERQGGQLSDLKDWTIQHRLDHLDG